MKFIMDNWRGFLVNEKKGPEFAGFKAGIQDGDVNLGKSHDQIAANEYTRWQKNFGKPPGGSSHLHRRTWKTIAKYVAAFGEKQFGYWVYGTLKGDLFGKGKKNPAWSAGFIQYCMIASGDIPWKRIQGTGKDLWGAAHVTNHSWYWAGAYKHTLSLQDRDQTLKVLDDDWIFIPLDARNTNPPGKTNSKINFLGKDVGYPKPRPGDIVLILGETAQEKGRRPGRYHGDIMTSGGRVGGNTSAGGGRVGRSTSKVAAILTKNQEVKESIRNFLSNQERGDRAE